MENPLERLLENLQLIDDFAKRYDLLKQKLPYHINVIDELHVNENANSRILASLLLYNSEGKYPLLESFINFCIKDWNIEVSHPYVTSEEMRIDLLVREKGKYAIIFENKIYEAILQKNQIARYIQKLRQEGFKDEQIYVVFLPPSEYEPDICSWQEPKECCETCNRNECLINKTPKLRESFIDRFKIVTFREDILLWLKKEVIPNCKQKEVYLYTAAMQYLDYLEGYFDLRTMNMKMNMELKDYLYEKLKLNELSTEEKMKVLEGKAEEINRLLNQINVIKESIQKEFAIQDVKNWEPYRDKIRDILSSIGDSFQLKTECDFFDPSNSSHLFIKLDKEDWQLSIIIEKYGFPDHSGDESFIYIGIPQEKKVDSKYWVDRDNKIIFNQKSYKEGHPYGWEWIDRYNRKPDVFQYEIDNGQFQSYLFNKVENILKLIEQKQLSM
ncbi:MAG: PD-(D/E)XK nuclease family protein [Prevotella sp.]|nr:PD-(D/E)XK nuclease family protein [Prevotella sp.]